MVRQARWAGRVSHLLTYHPYTKHQPKITQECVRRRAELSLQVDESCRDRAKAVIDKVFARCYSDTAPFDKIP